LISFFSTVFHREIRRGGLGQPSSDYTSGALASCCVSLGFGGDKVSCRHKCWHTCTRPRQNPLTWSI